MPVKKERQYRSMTIAVQPVADSKLIESEYYVEGYATTFERYKLYDTEEGGIYEQMSPDCFAECDMSDVIMQYDHCGRVFARQSNGTLVLIVDEKGLKIGADLSKTEEARKLYEDIKEGMCTKMSFSFMPQEWKYDKDTRTLVHTKIKKVFDVSAVSLPANDTTEINSRNFCDGVIAKVKQELLMREKQKLELKIKLGGF